MTRRDSTCVLPEPALAETHTECRGSAAIACRSRASRAGIWCGCRSFDLARIVVAARRPFEHARQMIVVAVDLALAERQRARQVALRRVWL